jgi:hypothetical protein
VRRFGLVTTVLLLQAAASAAEQIDYGVKTQMGWTDNVYGTSDDAVIESQGQFVPLEEVDDFSGRISPWAQLSDPEGDLTWSLRYQPAYEYYIDEAGLRGFDHDASAVVTWRVGERTTLSLSEYYREYRTLLRFNENAGSLTEAAVLRGRRDEITGSFTTLGLRHVLTPRDEVDLSASYSFRDYDQETSSDLESAIMGGGYRHSLTPRTAIGVRGSWTRQSFERSIGNDAETDYYYLSGTLEHQFSRTLRVELAAGPTLIDTDRSLTNFLPRYAVQRFANGTGLVVTQPGLCPVLDGRRIAVYGQFAYGCPNFEGLTAEQLGQLGFPAGEVPELVEFSDPLEETASGALVPVDDSEFQEPELTYFARASLLKEWERFEARVTYERTADESGSFGGASTVDSVELSVSFEPDPLWTFGLNGGVSLLEQASEAAIPRALVVESEFTTVVVPPVAAVRQVIVDVDDNALSYTGLYASFSASRRLTEHSSVFGAVYWYRQEQEREFDPIGAAGESSASITSKWDNLTFWVGLDWKFDTFKF